MHKRKVHALLIRPFSYDLFWFANNFSNYPWSHAYAYASVFWSLTAFSAAAAGGRLNSHSTNQKAMCEIGQMYNFLALPIARNTTQKNREIRKVIKIIKIIKNAKTRKRKNNRKSCCSAKLLPALWEKSNKPNNNS